MNTSRAALACLLAALVFVASGCGAASDMASRPDEGMTTSARPDLPPDEGTPPMTDSTDRGPSDSEAPAPPPDDEPQLSGLADDNSNVVTNSVTFDPPTREPASVEMPEVTDNETHGPVMTGAAPSTDVAHVDDIVKSLRYGNIVYDAPATMPFDVPQTLTLLLSPVESVSQLEARLQPTSETASASIRYANRMEAKLTGVGFDIEPLSQPVQAVTSLQPNEWIWKVTPTLHGAQELHMNLLAHIDVEGTDAALVVETKEAIIEVNITVAQRVAGFFESNWQWLWAAVILPIAGMYWRRKTGQPPRVV